LCSWLPITNREISTLMISNILQNMSIATVSKLNAGAFSQKCNTINYRGNIYCNSFCMNQVIWFRGSRMKIKKASEKYIEKAKNLTEEEVEKLQSRIREKLTRRAEDKKLSLLETLAIQLEFEDEQLAEWRKNIQEIRKKEKAKSVSKQ